MLERTPLVGNAIQTAHNAASFITSRLVGGAWAELANLVYSDKTHEATMEQLKLVAEPTYPDKWTDAEWADVNVLP